MPTTLAPSTVRSDSVAALVASVRGRVLLAGDPDLPAAVAGFNTAHEHTPAVVVVAACAEDVQHAVRYAAAADLPVGVLATGHSAPTVTGGVLVVTCELRSVDVDAVARTATVGGGAKWADVLPAITAAGLAPVVGSSSDVGVVGYHVGGGLSPIGRALGWAADSVVSFDVVTADGALRHVDPSCEPELFWALRGGKTGFGIVVAITFRLYPLTRFYGGPLIFAGDAAREVLHAWRALASRTTCPRSSRPRWPCCGSRRCRRCRRRCRARRSSPSGSPRSAPRPTPRRCSPRCVRSPPR